MNRLHLVPTVNECNGVFQVARMLAREDGGRILPAEAVTPADLDGVEEVWVHGMWLPKEWRACRLALKAGKKLVRMTHGSLSPVYLERQGKWKKRLVAPIERRLFAKCDRVVVTGPWEEAWCRAWGISRPIETVDVKRFFVNVQQCPPVSTSVHQCLKVMYLGMRHPLKGVQFLERAVEELNRSICQSVDPSIELRIVSDAVGEAKEAAWAWCDVLCLPTLSENFGLVVAEALARGKRVITTDGAPAWEDCDGDGRLVYLKGYRDGDDETRVRLLKEALVARLDEILLCDSGQKMRARFLSMVVIALAGLLVGGCRSARMWGDLHAPHDWRICADESVAVATAGTLLPIVTDDVPDDRWAAMLLAQTIQETSGRKPDVYVERPGQTFAPTNGIFVGRVSANRGWSCALTNTSVEAFRVVASNGCVRFLGKADFAVFDWCERALGMRYYPKVGKSVLSCPEISVLAVDYSDRPVFEHRQLGWRAVKPWLKIAKAGSSHRGWVSVHQPHRWMTNETLKVSYPCIFETGETPMLCYGSPDTLDYYKWRIDRHIAGEEDSGGIVDTNRKVVTVCQWDAPIRCACERCQALYDESLGERGNASPIIWGRFLKGLSDWLKVAHPDYMISFLPYMNSCEVPRRKMGDEGWGAGFWGVEPLENCEAEVCTMPGVALMKNRQCKANEERIIRAWAAATGRKVLNWHYSCWPQEWTAAPYVFGHTIQEHYADMREVLCGSYICGSEEDPRMALSLYAWMRCLWNPDVNVEAIYDEFAFRTFGPAAVPMRRLIALQEACWNRQWKTDDCSYRNIFEVSFRREDVERMKVLAREADQLALQAEDPVAVALVRWYASGFEEFVAESDALAARKDRRRIAPGEACEMVAARSALYPQTWAATTVKTAVESGTLVFEVRCDDPAAERMDFSRLVDDAVWGNDCVTFVVAGEEDPQTAVVYLTGDVEKGWPGFSAQVSSDTRGWTVVARVPLSEEALRTGQVLGNVARWRVGDRRLPEKARVPGSRYEQSRLNTVYTNMNADPAAFVAFELSAR